MIARMGRICYKWGMLRRLGPLFPLFFALLFPAPELRAEKQLLDRVVAVVNNDVITQSELDMILRPLYEEYRHEFKGEELYKRLSELRIKILNQLIEDRLVFQEAEKVKIVVDQQEIQDRLKEFKSRFATEQEMEQALREQGMTMASIKDRLRRQAMIRSLHDAEIRSKVLVSPLEVQDFYEQNSEQFQEMERLRPRSLTIKKSTEAREKGIKDEEAWNLIQDLRKRAEAGEDFSELAKKYSQDMHARNGGLGDWIERGDMISSIDEVLFRLKKGELSEVIETPMGYHLFRVEERHEGKKLSLEEARDKIHAYLYQKKSEERFEQWMDELKSQAYISVR